MLASRLLTEKERAEALEEFYTRWANDSNGDRQAMLDAFEKAFTEAIEEQRETSAKILDGLALNERNRGEISKAECAEFAAACVRNQTNRLIALNSGLSSAAISMVIFNDGLIYQESIRERLEKWVFKPLCAMVGSQGFLVLMALLPLYERSLRQRTCPFGDPACVREKSMNELMNSPNQSRAVVMVGRSICHSR